jgi:hypothetical protein
MLRAHPLIVNGGRNVRHGVVIPSKNRIETPASAPHTVTSSNAAAVKSVARFRAYVEANRREA